MLLFQVHKEKNYTSPDGSLSYEELERQFLDVFSQAEHAFKINFACGIILRNVTDGTYLYFHPMESDPVLKAPMLITSRVDIAQLMDTIKRMDLIEEMVKRRPNTKYVFHQLANIVYFTYDLEYMLGKGDEGLPAFISNRHCIIDLVSDLNGKNLYEDRKCFFRCLALHRGEKVQALERPTQALLDQWCFHKGIQKFKGVQLSDIPEVEDFFKVNINIYELMADGIEHTAKAVYVSTSTHESTMHMNLYKNHLSFITNFNTYAKRWKCRCCDKLFSRIWHFQRHEKTCTGTTKLKFPGGYWCQRPGLFERLEQHGMCVPREHRIYKMFACFNFEAILDSSENQPMGHSTTMVNRHRAISVALASNVCSPDCKHAVEDESCPFCQPFRKAVCFVNADEDQLLTQMLEHLSSIQEVARSHYQHQFRHVFLTLDKNISILSAQLAEKKDDDDDGEEDGGDQAMEVDEPDEAPDPRMVRLLQKRGTFNRFMDGLMREDRWEVEYEEEGDDELEEEEGSEPDYQSYEEVELKKQLSLYESLKKDLEQYVTQMPVLGFNSSK